jgi:phosphomevalonate kinase
MDSYDVVIEKTVKDLFKSSTLPQIKKYKFAKEKEIYNKDEELQKMILDKYPILIKSINSLEEINKNLNELQEIRRKFKNGINNLEELKETTFFDFENDDKDENMYDIEGIC